MVKLPKRFSVGERVFAKVRGYPPWPAKIQSITDPNTKNAKYHVIFFGTKEIGTCKVDDLFQYADNKDKFTKSVRRKFFQEGLQELEEDLKNDPGANNSLDSVENVPKNSIANDLSEIVSGSLAVGDVDNLVIDETEKKKNIKRKSQNIPITPDVTDAKKKRGRKSMAAITTVAVVESTPKQDSAQESQDEDGEKKNVSRSGRKIKPKRFHDSIDAEISIDASKNDTVRNRTKSKAEDENPETPVAPPKKRTFDEREDKKKDETEAQLQFRLNTLRTEEQLAFLDTQIRSSLGLEHANTDDCLDAMNQLLDFPLTPFMLKKHSHAVETIKRLRRYVGNLHDWKLTEEETAAFKDKASQIKKKAELIYDKFKALFTVPEGKTFWVTFSEQVARLKECTKDLTQEEFFALLEDPTDSQKSVSGKAKQSIAQAGVMSPVAGGKNEVPAAGAEAPVETETPEEAGISAAVEAEAAAGTSDENMS